MPSTDDIAGAPESFLNKTLEAAASHTQSFAPTQSICAHLNAFHAYAHDLTRPGVETNHYCAHLNDDVRQCILYDSPEAGARIIGIEYMITAKLFSSLDAKEQALWHTHIFEVKSGMLIMPRPAAFPEVAWEVAENKEMEQVAQLYGKVYHLWQTGRGDKVPLGEPQLMTSYTAEGQMRDFEGRVGERDARFGSDWKAKKESRRYIEEPRVNSNADAAWKEKLCGVTV